jgi:hypothetical protein
MCILMSLFGLANVGIVDRVEGPMAVVEWAPDSFSDVPTWLLPNAREGDHVCLAGVGTRQKAPASTGR